MSRALKVVISDFHLGKGHRLPNGLPNLMEDFHQDQKFVEFLHYYSRGEGRQGAEEVELVINGDFLDYLSVDISGKYPDALFESWALEATRLICEGHPLVMRGLRDFAASPGCTIRYNMGNHDPAIVWPSVQAYLEKEWQTEVTFGFDDYTFDDVRIEHGHQREVMHQFDTEKLILPAGMRGRAEPIINFPFGCFFCTQFLNGMRMKRHYIAQVVPFALYMRWAIVNDFWFTILQGFRVAAYFIKMRFIRHPYRFMRFSKTLMIMREIIKPPDLAAIARKQLENADYRVLIMGHNHEACVRLFPSGKQYVNSGTWTAFTSFDPALMGRHLLLTYVVVTRDAAGEVWRVDLKKWNGRASIEETLNS